MGRWRKISVGGVAEGGDILLDVEDQHLGAGGPVALGILADNFLGQFERASFGFLGFFLVGFSLVDLDQVGAAPSGGEQGFRCGGGLFVLFDVLLVHVSLFVGAFGCALPVAAQFIFEQVKGGDVCPFGTGKFLHYQLHPVFVDLASHVGIALAGGGTCEHVGAVDLPADVGGAVKGLGCERRSRK